MASTERAIRRSGTSTHSLVQIVIVIEHCIRPGATNTGGGVIHQPTPHADVDSGYHLPSANGGTEAQGKGCSSGQVPVKKRGGGGIKNKIRKYMENTQY